MALTPTSKRGKTVDVPLDLFAELPRHVIDVIVEHLPLCDAARLSVLSSKWLDIWRSKQTLVFDDGFFWRVLEDNLRYTEEFSSIVSKILFQHSGHLFRFHLEIPSVNSLPDVDQWICYLSRTGVSDICIDNQYRNPPLTLSRHIFSCGNLEKLKLRCFIINPPHNCMSFKKMTRLELDQTTLTEKAFTYLIRGCPLLQYLRLTNFIGMEHITIDAPHLSCLIVDGTFLSLDVRNAENLVWAIFGLQKYVDICHKASLCVLMKALASSHKLRQLVFKGYFIKVLYKESLLPSTFENVRWLELKSIHLNKVDEFDSIISIIQACPAVLWLNISVNSSSKHKTSSRVFDYNPSSVLHRLCYANVHICRGSNMEMKLVEFLLECSPILKKLSLTTSAKDIRSVFRPETTSQLIHFRRASPNLEISCPDLPSSYHYCSGCSGFSYSSDSYMSESD